LARFKCPHTLYFLCLKYPQQFGLRSERHIADFIQEQRPAIRIFEQTYFVICRTRERTSLVTEQFALEKCLDYCGRITHSKGTRFCGAELMQSPSDEFFAGSSLPGNEHRPKVRCHLADSREHIHHCGTSPDHALKFRRSQQLRIQTWRSLSPLRRVNERT